MAKQAKSATAQQPTPKLPPKEPRDREQLERAIVLLGSRAKGLSLSPSIRVELSELVGAYPDPFTAACWKLGLKMVRNDEIFDQVG